jgi:hypothetical protein
MTAVTCAVILAVLFFAISYNQMFSTHKTAQTALDAAALQAANDMSRIVVDGSLGKIALVDDMPSAGASERPILGINTVLATIRLDAIIGQYLGNQTIQTLANEDLQKALSDAALLQKEIESAAAGKNAKDKDGNSLNLQARVEGAYDANALRQGTGKRTQPLKFTFGRLSDAWAPTSTPIPVPNNLAQLGGNDTTSGKNGTVYRAYTPINTQGLSKPISFVAIDSEPRLIDNTRIIPLGAADTPVATVVQIEATHMVKPMSGTTQIPPQATVTARATAQAGGRSLSFASGVLIVNFPEGISIGNNKVDFSSVSTIMAGAGKWDGTGTWGPPYRNRAGDDPSIALSCQVYDWLRTLGLRPNITAVKTALDEPFIKIAYTGDWNIPGVPPQIMAEINGYRHTIAQELKAAGCPPAWAQTIISSGGNPWLNSNIKSVYPATPVGTPNYYPGPHIRMVAANTAGSKREYFNGSQSYHIENGQTITDSAYPPSLKTPTNGYQTEYRDTSTGTGVNYHLDRDCKIFCVKDQKLERH